MLVFKMIAPIGRGKLTAATAIVNVTPDDLAKCCSARRRVKVIKEPRIESHCGKIASAVTF